MPLSGTIPDTPPDAVLVFEVKNGDLVAVARGLAAAHAVFAQSEVAPHIALMAEQEVSNLWVDSIEASNYEIATTGKDLLPDPEWDQMCMEAEVWEDSKRAALLAYCNRGPEQKLYYRFYMTWEGHKLDLGEETWWPYLHVAGPTYLSIR